MPRPGIERTVRQSIVDRLIDREPRQAADRPITKEESVRLLKSALMRDLDWLFNTRRVADPAPDSYPEVQHSVYHYGLPDISSLSGDSKEVRRFLVRRIEHAVQQFEPRLENVKVSLVEEEGEHGRSIHFLVDGMLRMDPNPEHIAFDTVLETIRGEFHVGGGNA